MKPILFALIAVVLAQAAEAQFSIAGPAGKSGIVAVYDRSVVNYEVGTSKASFTIGFDDKRRPKNYPSEDAFPDLENDFLFNLQVGVPITDNIGSLFGKGQFNPGIEAAFQPVYLINQERYWAFFGRLEYAVNQTKFGYTDTSNRVVLLDKAGHGVGFGLGVNKAVDLKEKVIAGLSFSYYQNYSSPINLKKADFVTATQTLPNAAGGTVTINTKEERFVGQPVDLGIFQTRLDWVFGFTNFIADENRTAPMFSLITGLSYSKFSNDRKSWYFSAGPGLHPKNNYGQILASLQFELNDIGNNLGLSPTFKEQFGVKLYLGVPLNLFKKKDAMAAGPAPVPAPQ